MCPFLENYPSAVSPALLLNDSMCSWDQLHNWVQLQSGGASPLSPSLALLSMFLPADVNWGAPTLPTLGVLQDAAASSGGCLKRNT